LKYATIVTYWKCGNLVFVYIFKELLFVVLQKIYDIMCLWFDVLISALHMLFACLLCVLFHLSFFRFFLNYILPYSSFPLRIDLLHFQKGSTLIGELVYSVQLLFSFHQESADIKPNQIAYFLWQQ